ncbi:GNAT family N-acetyltransferase [Brachybacterium ginsengisoli]|uniref:GNAT family N-acetyltransferase n=1 Tax=Brachybacterium ginsengisoli TaxID=1331682 RepID=A0A291GWZ1_9MICO|nr:GNAT family N-acetyltransferase [Brachybacterium ginsengisoli]ATG54719.1 GNAT family N-acetyltransferase [Brachybacterium ginsengisoli]
MPVRELTAEDLIAYRMLSAGAFGGSVDPSAADAPQSISPGRTLVGIDSSSIPGGQAGVIAAGAEIRYDRIALGGGVAGCGGIGGLSVHPAHRGDGLFGALVTGVLARCLAESLPLSMLYASNPSIYRRYGYQVVARPQSLIVPLVDLQRIAAVPDRRLVPVTEATMPRLRELHHELIAGDNAMLRREPPLFPEGLPALPWAAVLLEDASGTAHGYVSWTRRGDATDGIGLDVHELFGRTRSDRVALLRSLGSWSTVTELLRLRLRTDDPVLDVLPSGRARPDSSPVPLVMMRVVDTAATLRARRAPAVLGGTIRLDIEDGTVPEGTCRAAGSYLVTARDGAITVLEQEPSSAGDCDALGTCRLDVHAAALLLVGGRTLADARRLGLGAEADPAAEAFLDALLAGPRPSVLDAF